MRKELTPVEGDTKCSIYLASGLDYEVHSSYVMQIIAEVSHRPPLTLNIDTNTRKPPDFPVIHSSRSIDPALSTF